MLLLSTTNYEQLPETDPVTVLITGSLSAGSSSASCVVEVVPTLGGGSGYCTLSSDTALLAGDYTASATYAGDADLSGSGPSTAPFTVTSVSRSLRGQVHRSMRSPYAVAQQSETDRIAGDEHDYRHSGNIASERTTLHPHPCGTTHTVPVRVLPSALAQPTV